MYLRSLDGDVALANCCKYGPEVDFIYHDCFYGIFVNDLDL